MLSNVNKIKLNCQGETAVLFLISHCPFEFCDSLTCVSVTLWSIPLDSLALLPDLPKWPNSHFLDPQP